MRLTQVRTTGRAPGGSWVVSLKCAAKTGPWTIRGARAARDLEAEAMVEKATWVAVVVSAEAAPALAWEANSFGDGRG